MIGTAIGLALIAAFCDWYFGIKEPWRKIIIVGIAVLLIVGLINLLAPGLLSSLGRW